MSLLSTARRAALGVASATGVFTMVGRSAWRRRRLCILCFHGIALDDEHRWRPGLYLTPAQFDQRMASLAALNASVLTLSEGLERLAAGSLPERAVVITFDDGCHDFYRHALPTLERHNLPSTVYLTTYYSGRKEPVLPLAIDYLLWKSGRPDFPGWPRLALPTAQGMAAEPVRRTLALRLSAALRAVTDDQQALLDLLEELGSKLGVDATAMRRKRLITIMPPDEVLAASQKQVAMELHTHRHRTPRDRALFLRELSDNRDAIVDVVGRVPRHFCYPSGDVDVRMRPWLHEAGVLSATTCDVALAQAGDDPYLLPRFLDTSAQPQASFDGWVSGAAAFLSRHARSPGTSGYASHD
jgi:peptidoglycan/xylan/chitin deacetylase (PgdA/CDA1 family)